MKWGKDTNDYDGLSEAIENQSAEANAQWKAANEALKLRLAAERDAYKARLAAEKAGKK